MTASRHFSVERKNLVFWTMLVITVVAALSTSVAIAVLYRAALDSQRERLMDTVQSLSRFAESVARFDQANTPDAPRNATLGQLLESQSETRGFGLTGEFLIAERDGDRITYLLAPRFSEAPQTSDWDAPGAETMRRALSGERGTAITFDYRGKQVLAAFGRIDALNVGIAAKIDLAEVREPFVKAALGGGAVSLLLILAGAAFYWRELSPVFERIQRSEERYRALFDLSPHGVLLLEAESGRHIDFNGTAHRQLGFDREAFGRMTVFECTAEGDQAALRQILLNPPVNSTADLQVSQRHHDGQWRNMHLHAQAIDLDGRPGLYCICQDVTENLAAKRELEQHRNRLEESVEARTAALRQANDELAREVADRTRAEEKLRLANMVFRTTVDGVFVTDAHGTILSVNPAFTQITGYSSEEAVGQNPRILKSRHQGRKFYRDLWNTLYKTGHFEAELWNRRKNGEAYLQQLTITAVNDEDGKPINFVSVFTDITELHEKEEHIQHQSFHDALTDLPNRTLFVDRLQQALDHSVRNRQHVAVLLFDLDRFKVINDTLGHHKGDHLLQLVADRLRHLFRQGDTVSRFGGDEFAVLINGVEDTAAVEHLANELVLGFEKPFELGAQELTISISAGIAVSPDDGMDNHVLLKNADTAMYQAKDAGRNNYRFYTADMNAQALDHLQLENALRGALDRGELELYYQPRIDLESLRVNGMEALLRWNHPEKGMVAPGQFISIAEESGLIIPIGAWVLREACRQTMRWRRAGHPLRVSVNLSARQFARADLLGTLDSVLAESGLPPDCLELELTETVVMQHADATVATLNAFKERGVRLAIDDFGTGYSSLSYLKRFPIDVLKIDQSFVRDLSSDPDDAAIAETIIALGHSLCLEVLAEGVETDSQLEFLRERACDSVQGYLFSRPLPASAFAAFLKENGEEGSPQIEYA